MIHAEWALRNTEHYPLYYHVYASDPVQYTIQKLDGQGKPRVLCPSVRACDYGWNVCSLPARKFLRGDHELLSEFSGIYGLGKFKIWAERGIAYSVNPDGSDVKRTTLKSNEICFEICKPAGVEADAIALLDAKTIAGVHRKDPEEVEDFGNLWVRDRVLAQQLMAKYPSSRHAANAALFYWLLQAPHPVSKFYAFSRKQMQEAMPHFRFCQDSRASSPFIRRMAAARLLELTALDRGPKHPEVIALAKDIAWRYPDTMAADTAIHFLPMSVVVPR
jgi:hypothetical protein